MTPGWLTHVKLHGCGVLPREVERTLMSASKVGSPGSRARTSAVNRAYAVTTMHFPHLFKY